MKKIKTKGNLNSALMELEALDAQIKKLSEEREGIAASVKAFLKPRVGKEVTTEGYTVKLSEFPRNNFQTSLFKEAYPEIYNNFNNVTMSSRLTYSQRVDG